MNRKDKELKANRRTVWINTVVFAVLFICEVCYGRLLNGPNDTTTYEGESVILQCKTDLPLTVFWYFNGKEIFYGGKISLQYASYFSIKSDATGEYHLVISSANSWYNGQYTCADDEGEGEKLSAWLTVSEFSTTIAPNEPGESKESDTKVIIIAVIASVVVLSVVVIAVIMWRCGLCKPCHGTDHQTEARKPAQTEMTNNHPNDTENIKLVTENRGKDNKDSGIDGRSIKPAESRKKFQDIERQANKNASTTAMKSKFGKQEKINKVKVNINDSLISADSVKKPFPIGSINQSTTEEGRKEFLTAEQKDTANIAGNGSSSSASPQQNSAADAPGIRPSVSSRTSCSSLEGLLERDSCPQQGPVAKPRRTLEEKSNPEETKLIPKNDETIESNRSDDDGDENDDDAEPTRQMASDIQQENESSTTE